MTQKQIFSNYHPPTYEACNIILLNMKNHYRRLYTVKPAVDTSPPESYKLLSRKTNRSLSCLDLSLSDIPAYKFYQGSEKMKAETPRNQKSQRNIKPIIKRHSCVNGDQNLNHQSRSKSRLKSAVSSGQKNSSAILISSNSAKDFSLKEKVLFDACKTGSESSQDSAYNEGEVGSSERGTRTPTPETIVNNLSKHTPNVPLNSSAFRRKANNYLYLKFLADITDEILKKGVVTNKALKRIFQDHFEANSHQLNQNRMLLELETLREKLGVPEEDCLNSANFGLGSGNGSPNCIPLFKEEDLHSEENYTKTSSSKSESVFERKIASSKNSMGSDMLEAFTTLSDNKKLIDSIQESIKNTTTNLQQVSQSSQFSSYINANKGGRSSDFEYDSPPKTSISKACASEESASYGLQKLAVNGKSPDTNQQRKLSHFNLDNPQKISENKISTEDTVKNLQMSAMDQLPVNPNHQKRMSDVRSVSFLKARDDKITSSEEAHLDIAEKVSLMNSQLPNTDVDQRRTPPPDLFGDAVCEFSNHTVSSLKENTVNSVCSNDFVLQPLDLVSNHSSSSNEDCLADKPTDIHNLGVDLEKNSISDENCIDKITISPSSELVVDKIRPEENDSYCATHVTVDGSNDDHIFDCGS